MLCPNSCDVTLCAKKSQLEFINLPQHLWVGVCNVGVDMDYFPNVFYVILVS